MIFMKLASVKLCLLKDFIGRLLIGRHGDGYFLNEHGVFEVHVSLVQNLELLPLARIMMQLSHVQIRKEPKLDFKNFASSKALTVT